MSNNMKIKGSKVVVYVYAKSSDSKQYLSSIRQST